MITLSDENKVAEILVKKNGKDCTVEFLKNRGITPNLDDSTPVPDVDEIINAMIEFEDEDPKNHECEVTFQM